MSGDGSAISVHATPGAKIWLALDCPASSWSIVFEDDSETGYLYACDRSLKDDPILDAVQIYAVSQMPVHSVLFQMRWSSDGAKAGIWLDGRLCGAVDFGLRMAYSRNNFPPSAGAWSDRPREPWRDALIDLFD
ncbi:MAG TPA: DUF2251 domain-containing protein [Caulobacteraceae bacterium]|nr:DUF2251 domain-containing protein [Caulobacteraceae bacterium]